MMRVLLLFGSFVTGIVLALPAVLLGYPDSVAFSPDGKTLARNEYNNVVILDAATLAPRRILTGHGNEVNSVAFSPDGTLFAAGSYDKTVLIWDTKTWQRAHLLAEPKAIVYCMAFTPDGKTLVAGLSDGNIRFWNVVKETQERTLHDVAAVQHLALSRDGKLLAAGLSHDDPSSARSWHDTASLWDVTTGKRLHELVLPTDMVSHVAFSPDGKTLATADRLAVTLWDTTTGNRQPPLAEHGWAWAYRGLAFSPDGKTLAAGSAEGAFFWDVATRKLRRKAVELQQTTCLAFSPDGAVLAVELQNGYYGLFNPATGELRRPPRPADEYEYYDSPFHVAFGPDGKTVALGMFTQVVLCTLADGKPQRTLGKRHDQHCGDYRVAFNPDGSQLIAWLGPPWPFGPVEFWNPTNGEHLRTLKIRDSGVFALGPDGVTLATGSSNGGVTLWDTTSKTPRRTLRAGEDDDIADAAFSPDGKIVGAATWRGAAVLWDAATGVRRRTLIVPESKIVRLKFSPDSKTLATAQEGGPIILWDAVTGQQHRTLSGHLGDVRCMDFSPDGTALASGATDAAVVLWDPARGTPRRKLIAHVGPVSAVAFSRDGKTLASAPYHGSAILWDAATGKQRGTVPSLVKKATTPATKPDRDDPFSQ
jgi:WD40 repeat protein